MKTRFFGVMALLVSILAMTACQKDKADYTWKQLPVEQISVESGNAVITVNEVLCTYGNAQLVASGENDAVLTLTGAVPGFAEVKVNVELLKKSEDSFHFSGIDVLSAPPSIAATLRSVESSGFYTVSVEGDVTVEGKISVGVTTYVSSAMTTSLKGSWNIVRKCKYGEGEPVNGPAQITWKVAADAGENIGMIVGLANTIVCPLLAEVFNQVTFDETGNIMAQYYSNIDLGDDPLATILGFADVKPDSDGNVTYTAHHTDWIDSPKANLAFWYAQGSSLFVVPNVAAIMDAAEAGNTRADVSGIDMSSIMEIISSLKEYGVDVNALNAELQKMLSRGVELKYSQDGDNLKIYVDKALCDPIVEALFPALKTLDAMLEELSKSDDPDDKATVETVQLIMGMLGLEKPSDFALVWKATTEFEIALNFTKA